MLKKLLILLLSVLLPIQFNFQTVLEFKNLSAKEGSQRQEKIGDSQNAGQAIINNTDVLGVKGSDLPEPIKEVAKFTPQQGMLIQTERWGSMAVMIAIAITGMAAFNACQGFSMDLLIFGAGAMIYLAGEAVTTFMYKGIHHQEITVVKERGKLDDNQKTALEDQKKSYQAAIAVTKLKEMFQLAAGAAFFAASIVSAVLTSKLSTGYQACLASAVSSAVALQSTCHLAAEVECPTMICSGVATALAKLSAGGSQGVTLGEPDALAMASPGIVKPASTAAAVAVEPPFQAAVETCGATLVGCSALAALETTNPPLAYNAAYNACMPACIAEIAKECSGCGTGMSAFAAELPLQQARIVAVGPSNGKVFSIENINVGAQRVDDACLKISKTQHPVCPAGTSRETAIPSATEGSIKAEAQRLTAVTEFQQLGESITTVVADFPGTIEKKAKNEQTEMNKKAEKIADQVAQKGKDAAASVNIAHAPVLTAKTKEACAEASYMTRAEFMGCPKNVSIPGFSFHSPEDFKKHNPWFKFLMNDVYAQSEDTRGGTFDVFNQTQNADSNQDKIKTIMGFGFVGVVVVAGLITKGLFSFFDKYLSVPYTRTVLFGMVGAASLSTAALSFAIEKTLEENVRKIDTIIKGIPDSSVQTRGGGVTAIPFNEVTLDMVEGALLNNAKLTDTGTFPCLRGDGKGNCLDTGTTVEAGLRDLGIDADTLAAAGLAAKTTDSVSGRSSAGRGTFSSVGALAAMAGKMRAKAIDFRSLLNSKLAQSKIQPIDFDDHEKKFASIITKSLKDAGARNPSLFASVSQELKGSTGSDQSSGKSKLEKEYSSLMKSAALPSNISAAQMDDILNTNYDYQGSSQDQELAKLAADNSYDIPKNDIQEVPSEDLFKMITIRYLKTAYPIFFKEEKIGQKKKN